MSNAPAELIGPDFLQRLGEQQLAAGLETDFATLQANARAWNRDRARLQAQEAEIDQLRNGMGAIHRGARIIAEAAGKAAVA